ncbi:unnamed protein product [Miscanthus lutarioriparius]|uniref:Glutaredoxin domain-containing protein n=1 Tax=Miscanthus lutarioriparius TaxID=422564 RepID=A0A811RJD7_9POAL|nr:unnamed protein product [Miscanthus lutarioriparius]
MAERVSRLSTEKAAVIFTTSQCPMCHTVTSLLSELGVCAAVHELDKDPRGREMERELARRPSPPSSSAAGSSAPPTRSYRCTSPASSCPGAIWL